MCEATPPGQRVMRVVVVVATTAAPMPSPVCLGSAFTAGEWFCPDLRFGLDVPCVGCRLFYSV